MKARNLMLKSVGPNGESHGEFIWPLEVGAMVTAPDWNERRECGGGLHGFLGGKGNGNFINWYPNYKWLVVECLEKLVPLEGQVKCKSAIVRYVGDIHGATQFLYRHGHKEYVMGITLAGGDYAIFTGGYRATLTGGDFAMLTGGNSVTLTGGDYAMLTGGSRVTLTGGDYAMLTGGDSAKLTGGYHAALTGGDFAKLTGGNDAILIGGYAAKFRGGLGSVFVSKSDVTVAKVDDITIKCDVFYTYKDQTWKEDGYV